MRLRHIFLVMSLFAFFSTLTGGYFYYSSLRESALKRAEREAVNRLAMMEKNISSQLSQHVKPVRTLSRMTEIRDFFMTPSKENRLKANRELDLFKNTLDADVCYLIDARGVAAASSNRDEPDSFVGKKFDFRPYFKEAMGGGEGAYLALGTASKRRGAYFSRPVYGRPGAPPAGVAVIKTSIDLVENGLHLENDEIISVVSPEGVLFICSREDWLFKSLFDLPKKKTDEIAASRQFGKGPFPWIGLDIRDSFTEDRSGGKYLINRAGLTYFPGWVVMRLQSYDSVIKQVSGPMIRSVVDILVILCALVGLSAYMLYNMASKEIMRRREAEKSLMQAKEELSSYSRRLEQKVRQRTEEITSILKYTPDVVYIKDVEGKYLMINPRYEALFGVKNAAVRGKKAHEFMPGKFAEEYSRSDRLVLEKGEPVRVENLIPQDDGVHTYLSVKFPVFDESGVVWGVGGISTDITALKKAQRQLRRLSSGIIEGQEKERAAISRELHDELGQVLTALRMEAAWIAMRLKDKDPASVDRAMGMSDLIEKTIGDVRNIARRLRPGVLDDLGLVDALEWHINDFKSRTGIVCGFRYVNVPALKGSIATTTYRIAQEALTNVARHAEAKRADILLEVQDGTLMLTVSDDGRGFDVDRLGESEGLGAAGMKERAFLAGGELDIESLAGEGTRVIFSARIQKPV